MFLVDFMRWRRPSGMRAFVSLAFQILPEWPEWMNACLVHNHELMLGKQKKVDTTYTVEQNGIFFRS